MTQSIALVVWLAAGLDQELGGVGDGGRRPRHFDAHRIVQELLGDAPDLRRHGGGEEQGLAGERHELADALDVGNEAHVEHAVGFVDDQELDAGEKEPPALVMIEQAWGNIFSTTLSLFFSAVVSLLFVLALNAGLHRWAPRQALVPAELTAVSA